MKMRRDIYSGLTCNVMWLTSTCLLFIFSLSTTITAKPTINEIDIRVTSEHTTNETCLPIMCLLYCPWGFEIDAVTGCPICKCWNPCCGIICPENETCVPFIPQCITVPCPVKITCENITPSSII